MVTLHNQKNPKKKTARLTAMFLALALGAGTLLSGTATAHEGNQIQRDMITQNNAVTQEALDHAMFTAIQHGSAEEVEVWLHRGANPNAVVNSTTGVTGLMLAAFQGNTEMARSFLRHGADINAQNKYDGGTAIMWAVSEGYAALTRLLIKENADLSLTMVSKQNVLMVAVFNSQIESLRDLLETKKIDIDAQDWDGATALIHAVNQESPRMVSLLLAHGADIDIKNKAGNSPMDIAREYEYKGIIKLLEQNEASKQTKTSLRARPSYQSILPT